VTDMPSLWHVGLGLPLPCPWFSLFDSSFPFPSFKESVGESFSKWRAP